MRHREHVFDVTVGCSTTGSASFMQSCEDRQRDIEAKSNHCNRCFGKCERTQLQQAGTAAYLTAAVKAIGPPFAATKFAGRLIDVALFAHLLCDSWLANLYTQPQME